MHYTIYKYPALHGHQFIVTHKGSTLNSRVQYTSIAIEDPQTLSEQQLHEIVAYYINKEHLLPVQNHIHGLLTTSTSIQVATKHKLKKALTNKLVRAS